jgi:hypothetical protein
MQQLNLQERGLGKKKQKIASDFDRRGFWVP